MEKRGLTRRAVVKLAGGAAAALLSIKEAGAGITADVTVGAASAQPKSARGAGKMGYAALYNSIKCIYEATGIPPKPPSEYQSLFKVIARECRQGHETHELLRRAVQERARRECVFGESLLAGGVPAIRRQSDDVDFVLDALSNCGTVLEGKSSSARLLESYRGFVFDKCDRAGLKLSEDERALIDVWFGSSAL